MADVVIRVRAEDRASKVFGSIGKNMKRALKVGAIAGAAAVVAGAVISIKAFSDFDAAMTKSLAIMGDVSDAMRDDMAQAARDVAKVTKFSAEQAAESYFFLASAGLSAEASIAALPVVSQFAQAGMFDMALATDLLTDAQSALGLTVDDSSENMANMAKVSDVLVKANTLANATVQQFSTSLTREAGAAMRSFGMDIEEGVAVLAAFADQGVKGEIAGSGLARILRLMTAGAEKNSEAYTELGISVFDASGNLNNMADIIQDLEVALGDMSDVERIAALNALGFSARIQGVILPLLGTSQKIRDYEAALREAGGTTKEVAMKQLATFSAQLGLLKDNLLDVAITIGGVLVPVLMSGVKLLIPWVRNFGSMASAFVEYVKAVVEGTGVAKKHFDALPVGWKILANRVGRVIKMLKTGFKPAIKALSRVFSAAFGKRGDITQNIGNFKLISAAMVGKVFGPEAAKSAAKWAGGIAVALAVLGVVLGTIGTVIELAVMGMSVAFDLLSIPFELLGFATGLAGVNSGAIQVLGTAIGLAISAIMTAIVVGKLASFATSLATVGASFVTFPIKTARAAHGAIKDFVTQASALASKTVTVTQNVARTGRKWITDFAKKTQEITQKISTVRPPKDIGKEIGLKLAQGIATGLGVGIGAGVIGTAFGAMAARIVLGIIPALLTALMSLSLMVMQFMPQILIVTLAVVFRKEIANFITNTLPKFFTDTIPAFAASIASFASGLGKSVVGAIADWFTPQNVGRLLADIVAVALITAFIGPVLIIKFRKEIVSFFSFVIGTFIKFFTKTLPNAVVKVITKLAKGIFNAGKLFVKVRKEIGKFEIKVMKAFVKFMTKTLPRKIASTASSFAKKAIEFISDLPGLVSEQGPVFFTKIKELVSNVAAGFVQQASIFAAKAIGFVADLPGLVRTFFFETLPQVISETIPETVAAVISGISTLPGLVEKVFNDVTEKVTGWVESVSTWLSENFAIWDWIKEAFNAFVARIGEWLTKIWGSGLITEWVSKLGTWLTANMNPWTWVKAAFELLVTSVGTEIGKVFTAVGGLARGAIDAIGNVTETLVQKGFDLLKGLATGYLQVWSDILTFFFNVATRIVGIVGDLAKTLFDAGVDIMAGFLKGALDKWEDVKDFFGGIAEAIAGLKGPASVDRVLLKGAGILIMEGLLDGIRAVKAALATLMGSISTSIYNRMKTGGIMAVKGFVYGVSSKFSTATTRMAQLRVAIVKALGDTGRLLYISGMNVMVGLINGMNSMAATLVHHINNLINLIPAAVRRLLGLSSPSKLFFGFGQDVISGFILGLQSKEGEMAGAIARIVSLFSDVGVQPLMDMGAAATQAASDALSQLLNPVRIAAISVNNSIYSRIVSAAAEAFAKGANAVRLLDVLRNLEGVASSRVLTSADFDAFLAQIALAVANMAPSFARGGFVPAGTVMPAVLHGPELVVPLRRNGGGDMVRGDTFYIGPIYMSGPTTRQDVRQLVDQIEDELRKRRRRGR